MSNSLILDARGNPIEKALVDPNRGWQPLIVEARTGDWQRGITTSTSNILTFGAVYACITLIANDVSKLKLRLKERQSTPSGPIWVEVINTARVIFSKPNRYQDTAQFIRAWMLSKLIHGNAYILKIQNRGKIVAMHVLDPLRVKVRVTDDGEILYEVREDNLAGVQAQKFAIESDAIIHDRMNPLYHDLCGISPISAIALSAMQGLEIQTGSRSFFANGARPSGIITLPEKISKENADILRDKWNQAYTGANAGKIAVLSGGVDYKQIGVSAQDAQLIEQLKLSSEMVCQAFHVPPFKVSVAAAPKYDNVEALNVAYYTDCLQKHIEDIEGALKTGLSLPPNQCAEFAIEDLLRMDQQAKMKALSDGTGAGILAPNEARQRLNLPPVKGGDKPYLQEQNWSLEDLSERREIDSMNQPDDEPVAANDDAEQAQRAAQILSKALA